MSKSIYKSEYNCDCGVNNGSCGAKCAVIIISNNTTDLYCIYHTDGHQDHRTNLGGLVIFGDAYLQALNKAINLENSNEQDLTPSEIITIKF